MKIRTDFVSNSSSSSFMLVGYAFDEHEIAKAWLKLHPKNANEPIDGLDEYDLNSIDICDAAYGISNELGLECERGISNYYDKYVLGLSFDKMGDDETKKQFIERIETLLKKVFDDVKAEPCLDGGYDG